jgi:hypothetical protein
VARTRWLRLATQLLVALAILSFLLGALGNREREIARVTAHATQLEAERDSITAVVDLSTQVQEALRSERDARTAEAAVLRDSVATLERVREARQLTVRHIRRTAELEARLEDAFPEMAASQLGLTTIPLNDRDTLGIEYFLIPAWFTETFLIDHQNAQSWRAQRDRLLLVDSLGLAVTTLQDSITRLEEGKSLAFQAGYDHAFTRHQDLTARYVAELKKPRFSLGSTLGLCLGAAGAGALVGIVIQD